MEIPVICWLNESADGPDNTGRLYEQETECEKKLGLLRSVELFGREIKI